MKNEELITDMMQEYKHGQGFAIVILFGVVIGFFVMTVGIAFGSAALVNYIFDLITKQ